MITIKGGNGTTLESAIKILGAENNLAGIETEYKIIGKEWKLLQQELHETDDNFYDKLIIQNAAGSVTEIWFDIKDFYGKWNEGDLTRLCARINKT